MLTTPLFQPWRSIWDTHFAHATRRLDELAQERQKGRQVAPTIDDWSDAQRIIVALQLGGGRVSSSKFLEEKIEPLVRACVWPRWLLLEDALDHASKSGDLHLSALVLRSQIEELDMLQIVATVLSRRENGHWDGDAMASAIQTLSKRVLPRLQAKTDEQLAEQASDAGTASARPESLKRAFDQLSEYVHPNYGSHILSVRPHDAKATMVLVNAFVAVYEAFLSLPWATDAGDKSEGHKPKQQGDCLDPYVHLVDIAIPKLKLAFPTVGEKEWSHAAKSFRHHAACESNWAGLDDLSTDVEAIRALREHSVPSDFWPDAFRTAAGRSRYAFLVQDERRLAEDAARLAPGTVQWDKERLSFLVAALTFAINVTEHKLYSLARQAARFVNVENVLGATLAVRSMLEHHAVAIELSEKSRALWERAEKGAPSLARVSDALVEAEKQVARVLAGSSASSPEASSWRTLWQEVIRKPYNVQGPVEALDAKQPGFLKTYGLLSHIVHGTVCTGGDLLGSPTGAKSPGHPALAQLTLFLASLCDTNAMLDRQAGSMTIAHRLDVVGREPTAVEVRIKAMTLQKGQKLKAGRDIFGSGTENEPFRFRDGLLYHDAYGHYLGQESIQVRKRTLHQFAPGFGDRVEAEDGRVLYFLNDKLTLE